VLGAPPVIIGDDMVIAVDPSSVKENASACGMGLRPAASQSIPRRFFLRGRGTKMPSYRIAFSFALASLLVLVAGSASADNYGAIAFSQSTGSYGYSYDYGSRGSAEQRALNDCSGNCSVVLWFKNACGSLATGSGGGYGYGWAGTRRRAESIAMSNCNARTNGCSILAWACTTR
jgi:hypothetical protein